MAKTQASAATIEMKLEAVVIAVTDVDRAKDFYCGLGWRLDADIGGKGRRAGPVDDTRIADQKIAHDTSNRIGIGNGLDPAQHEAIGQDTDQKNNTRHQEGAGKALGQAHDEAGGDRRHHAH